MDNFMGVVKYVLAAIIAINLTIDVVYYSLKFIKNRKIEKKDTEAWLEREIRSISINVNLVLLILLLNKIFLK